MGRAGVGRLGKGTGATALPVVPTARWAGVLGGRPTPITTRGPEPWPHAVGAAGLGGGSGPGTSGMLGGEQARWLPVATA